MRLIGRMTLEDLKREHSDVAKQIDAWCVDVEACSWNGPHDVKQRYGSADFPGGNKAIFNIKGNKYRILVIYLFPILVTSSIVDAIFAYVNILRDFYSESITTYCK